MEKTKLSSFSLIVVLGGVALTVLIIYLAILPGYQKLKDSSLSYANAKAELDAKQQKLDNLKALETTMQSENGKVKALRYALPREKDMPEVLYVLSTLANKNSLYVGDFARQNLTGGTAATTTTSEETVSEGIKQLTMQVAVAGSYPNLIGLMKDLEASRKIFQIDGIKVSLLADLCSVQPVTTLSLTSYYQTDN